MNQTNPHSGAWIFISHSNKDIAKVREIRNELERHGHNPVLFFLKSIENTDADDQLLWDLIAREIKAREWFILCDSPNAQASRAVLRERELVKSMANEGKVIETVDLSRDLQKELQKVIQLAKRATVFLSYTREDAAMAERIRQALLKYDYRVWSDADLKPGSDWTAESSNEIDEAVKHGFVLLLLGHESIERILPKGNTIRP